MIFGDGLENNQMMKLEKTSQKKAFDGFKKAGWLWDRAFTQAAAYLALTGDIPKIKYSKFDESEDFPFWVSIDKHTKEGKTAIREAAKQIGFNSNKAVMDCVFILKVQNATKQKILFGGKEKLIGE